MRTKPPNIWWMIVWLPIYSTDRRSQSAATKEAASSKKLEDMMLSADELKKFKQQAKLTDRYAKQLARVNAAEVSTGCIESAVNDALANLAVARHASLVIYGEPQSGKTEMMICLTAKLLDGGRHFIIHLMNDSIDLLNQSLRRFRSSGLAPSPRNSSELGLPVNDHTTQELVVFCKKNARDLGKLIENLADRGPVVVIDDEADYASPNAKINQGQKTKINQLIGQLIGDGFYIGVTATPARLDLNNTFNNDTEKWVSFRPHDKYTGQDVFFPLDRAVSYRLTFLTQGGSPQEARDALIRFLITAAYLNTTVNACEKNYTMLVHTSGRKLDHESDRTMIENSVQALIDSDSAEFDQLVSKVHETAQTLYPHALADDLTTYIVRTASRANLIVLNSERDRIAAGDTATDPSSPFTIVVGGNIVSRGVTFPNLLAMFFTRNVKHKLQQDTYIQRARMFGARGEYLEHFELTIPAQLYADWHRCFVFHRLALKTVQTGLGSPVWIGDGRVSVASSASIDKATVALDKGEMSFGIFDYDPKINETILAKPTSIDTLQDLHDQLGDEVIPAFLIDYIGGMLAGNPGSLAVHAASSISNYGASADQGTISRTKGFMGKNQLEPKKFPSAVHHVKIFFNDKNRAKLYYKYVGSLQFIQNLANSTKS